MTQINWITRLAICALAGGLTLNQSAAQVAPAHADALGTVVVSDQFNDLSQWRSLEYPFVSSSQYDLLPEGYLRAYANDSVSAIVCKTHFRPQQAPLLSWRWNVANVHPNGNALSENGDDFPIRVSVCFKFDPKTANAGERSWFEMKKLFYGEYPPYRILHYVFANRSDLDRRYLDCPYSERARIVIQRAGAENVNQWFEENVNIVEDYQQAFGETPPAEATISIMADGDNTEGSSTAFLDWIRVSEPDRS